MKVYVSTDLTVFIAPDDTGLAADFTQVDDDNLRRAYRLLDPLWYAWLCDRMAKLKTLAESRQISAQAWDQMRRRFADVWAHACATLGKEATADAAQIIPSATYTAPKVRRPYKDLNFLKI